MRFRSSLPLVVALSGAIASALSLWGASHKGLFNEVAGFGAGMAAGSIASSIVAGGMSLAFTTGDDYDRSVIYHARKGFVMPALVATAVVASLSYGVTTSIPPAAVFCGGLTVAANIYSELDAVLLQRHGRVTLWATLTCISRLLAPALVMVTSSYAVPLVTTSLALALSVKVSTSRLRPPSFDGSPVSALHHAYSGELAVYTIADTLALRAPLLVAPLALEGITAGKAATLISSQQTVLGVTASALYASMALQSGAAADSSPHVMKSQRKFDKMLISLSALSAVCGVVLIPAFPIVLDIPSDYAFSAFWTALCLAIPVGTLVRYKQYGSISMGNRAIATKSAVCSACVAAAICLISLTTENSTALITLGICAILSELSALLFIFSQVRKS